MPISENKLVLLFYIIAIPITFLCASIGLILV